MRMVSKKYLDKLTAGHSHLHQEVFHGITLISLQLYNFTVFWMLHHCSITIELLLNQPTISANKHHKILTNKRTYTKKSSCSNHPCSPHLQEFFTVISLSWTCELLHTTLQQNDRTSSSFPVTLRPWVKINVIQTGITLYSLVVFSIIPRLKQVMSWHTTMLNTTMLNTYFIDHINTVLSLEYSLCKIDLAWASANQ